MAKKPARRLSARAKPKPARNLSRKQFRKQPPVGAVLADLKTVATARQVFWSNVLREILVSLCVASMKVQQRSAKPDAIATASDEDVAKIFDGRLALITSWGLRLPIAGIEPVLGAAPSAGATAMGLAVECSVFQVRTTDGDVWTLPLHEVRAFHALTEELMQQLQKASEAQGDEENTSLEPFGFKAFTSLSRMQGTPVAVQEPDYLGE